MENARESLSNSREIPFLDSMSNVSILNKELKNLKINVFDLDIYSRNRPEQIQREINRGPGNEIRHGQGHFRTIGQLRK